MTTVILPINEVFYGDGEISAQELSQIIDSNQDRLKKQGLQLIQEIAPNTNCHQEVWSDEADITVIGTIAPTIINSKTGDEIMVEEIDWLEGVEFFS